MLTAVPALIAESRKTSDRPLPLESEKGNRETLKAERTSSAFLFHRPLAALAGHSVHRISQIGYTDGRRLAQDGVAGLATAKASGAC